ncbi:hypothetical protein HELRODRAFT_66732 [Helobdella robusta]|uniref:Protein cornichon homolog 4 n=1 Tax=Helobdella robusta TaxID=6412 RepID=T1FYP9_HELRO|nr:hypothetical protein HELRODRAFT_66732 [Helobdella robusta]ESN99183.1 hypothetical protein HELRODRAFT_66732 [Helobdella robusta]
MGLFISIYSLVESLSMLGISVFYMITLSDLECDYINSKTCCGRLNKVVIPEILLSASVALLHLIDMQVILFLYFMLMPAWTIYKYATVPSGNLGVFDPIEIHNRQQLSLFIKETMVKIGYHLVAFFLSLYWLFVLINSSFMYIFILMKITACSALVSSIFTFRFFGNYEYTTLTKKFHLSC